MNASTPLGPLTAAVPYPASCWPSSYLAATVLFYPRHDAISEQAGYYFRLLREMGSEFPQPQRGLHAYLRKFLRIGSAVVTLFLVFRPIGWKRKAESPDTRAS